LAHWYEKSFFSAGKWYRGQGRALARQLQTALSQWRQSQNTTPPDLAWAQQVLDSKLQPIPTQPSPVSPEQAMQLLARRQSCRMWTPEPLSDGHVSSLLEAGIAAPSSANRQSVRFFLVHTSAEKKAIGTMVKHDFLAHAPVLILLGVDNRSYHAHEHDRLVADAAVAAENMMLYATAADLGSCLITPHEIEDPVFKASYGIPAHIHMLMILSVGHPRQTFVKPPRMAVQDYLIGSA
jgi:nitroreductase